MHPKETEILFNIGAWTGQRLKDCALLKWDMVDFKINIIKVIPAKTSKKKTKTIPIPIHPDLKNVLMRAKELKIDEFVLPHTANRYSYNPSGVSKDCMKILKYSGLKTTEHQGASKATNIYGFHSFRHTFATYLFNAGVSMSIIEILTGTSIEVLMNHYVHLREGTLQDAIKKLPRLEADVIDEKTELLEMLAEELKKLSIKQLKILADYVKSGKTPVKGEKVIRG